MEGVGYLKPVDINSLICKVFFYLFNGRDGARQDYLTGAVVIGNYDIALPFIKQRLNLLQGLGHGSHGPWSGTSI